MPSLSIFFVFLVGLAAVLLVFLDARYRRIPNGLCLSVLAIFLLRMGIDPDGLDLSAVLLHSILLTAPFIGFFLISHAGGGDVKAVAVFTLHIPKQSFVEFLIILCGISLLYLISLIAIRRVRREPEVSSGTGQRSGIPFGVPLGLSVLLTLASSG